MGLIFCSGQCKQKNDENLHLSNLAKTVNGVQYSGSIEKDTLWYWGLPCNALARRSIFSFGFNIYAGIYQSKAT